MKKVFPQTPFLKTLGVVTDVLLNNRNLESYWLEGRAYTVKKWVSKLFRWNPSRDALVAFAAGGVVVGLSAAMRLFEHQPWASILIRDVGQILLAGILFPLWWIHRSGHRWAEFGFSFRKWPLFLAINLVLGALLLLMFLTESPPPPDFHPDAPKVWSAA